MLTYWSLLRRNVTQRALLLVNPNRRLLPYMRHYIHIKLWDVNNCVLTSTTAHVNHSWSDNIMDVWLNHIKSCGRNYSPMPWFNLITFLKKAKTRLLVIHDSKMISFLSCGMYISKDMMWVMKCEKILWNNNKLATAWIYHLQEAFVNYVEITEHQFVCNIWNRP